MEGNVIGVFEDTAARFAERTAVSDGTDSLTFQQLRSYARGVARWLLDRGLGGRAIGVEAEQTVYTPALYLGITYAGGCYVPLDPELPLEKKKKILADCQTPVVLSWRGAANCGEIPCAILEREPLSGEPEGEVPVSPDTPLYLIYTSGSTGEPKGIVKTHGAVLNFLKTYREFFSFTEEDVLGNQTPFFFDASAKDFWMMVGAGCRLEILPRNLFTMPVRLIEYLNEKKVTVISWVPSALSLVSRLNTFRTVLPVTLHRVMFVGEVFQPKQLDRWRKACPQAEFVNLYGSSEIAGVCCSYTVREETPGVLPIGRALPNCSVRLVAEGKEITQPGVQGEIYVASKALAAGYYGNREKTQESFLVLRLGEEPPKRYFKTGDLAQYDEEGNLVFASRADFQIKHMGHRIELGEIEAAAERLPGVSMAACLYQRQREAICLFCAGSETDRAAVAAGLRKLLPAYMTPKRYFFLDEMPLTRSGKIDRVSLERRYLV